MPNAVPEFHQVTEDGVHFRIYKLGSLEVSPTDSGLTCTVLLDSWCMSSEMCRYCFCSFFVAFVLANRETSEILMAAKILDAERLLTESE